MSLLLIALCLGAGCLIGFMGGVLGIGGGMIAIPALVLQRLRLAPPSTLRWSGRP